MYRFTDDQKMLARSVAEMAARELAPRAEDIDEKEGFNAPAFKAMADMGLLGITSGEAYGGAGLGAIEATIAMDATGAACASTALSYLAHSILCVNNLHEN